MTPEPNVTRVYNPPVEQLNAQIAIYNSTSELDLKKKMQVMLADPTRVLSGDLYYSQSIMDEIISKCQDMIDRYE